MTITGVQKQQYLQN